MREPGKGEVLRVLRNLVDDKRKVSTQLWANSQQLDPNSPAGEQFHNGLLWMRTKNLVTYADNDVHTAGRDGVVQFVESVEITPDGHKFLEAHTTLRGRAGRFLGWIRGLWKVYRTGDGPRD